MGYDSGEKITSVAVNSPTIRLLSLECVGSEDNVVDCPGSSWGDHHAACDRQLAARIECHKETGGFGEFLRTFRTAIPVADIFLVFFKLLFHFSITSRFSSVLKLYCVLNIYI